MSVRTQAYIDSTALKHNVTIIRKLAPNANVLAMVKGNAYGHGLVAIGKILKDVEAFGVACLSEAIKLREGGIRSPIVIMSGVTTQDDFDQIAMYDLEIVLHELFQVKLLEASSVKKPLKIWLKVDTGMHRLGFPPETFKKVFSSLYNNPKVSKPIVVMTHFAAAEDINNPSTQRQLELFNEVTLGLSCHRSMANSAGIMAWPESIKEWNRPGIMLYGVSPLLGKTGLDDGLLPVMTLKSKIIAIHDFKKKDAIGYGGCWLCPEDMRVAVVAIGYGDGYPRHASNGTPVLINNVICPLVGRVSMDLLTVDLRKCPNAKIGDDVILWGNGLPAEIVAKYADTIAYELLCNISQRVDLVYQ